MEALNPPVLIERRSKQRNFTRDRLLLPLLPIGLDGPASTARNEIESFISERFKVSYQATISHFLPYFLTTRIDESLSAAVGFQPALDESAMFLETYLDDTIDDVLSDITSQVIVRNKIVEIGNLTSSRKGSSQMLFILIAATLKQAGFEWVVFTATKHVQQILNKLGLDTIALCEADPRRLSDKGDSWGSYYSNQPKVLAGNLDYAIDFFKRNEVINFMLETYQDAIDEMAKQIKNS